jgi:site-specific recombinase XerD
MNNGVSIESVSKMLGHNSLATELKVSDDMRFLMK